MNRNRNLKDVLKYHVTGAIERGEATPIREVTKDTKCENCGVRYRNAKLIPCQNIFGHYFRAVQP